MRLFRIPIDALRGATTGTPELDQWVRTISKMARKTPGGK
jgi:hypothetical protein